MSRRKLAAPYTPNRGPDHRTRALQMALESPGAEGHKPGLPWISGPNGPILALSDDARHLVVWPYNPGNLHVMAESLGIGRHWYHGQPYPHYDIPKRRIEEIHSKSLRVTSKEIVRIIQGQVPKFRRKA